MSDDWREKNEEVAASFRESARREGRGYRVVCPFCTSSKTGRADYSLSVTGSGLWHCHRCEEGGKLQDPPDGSEADVDEERETPEIEPPEGYVPLGLEPGLACGRT